MVEVDSRNRRLVPKRVTIVFPVKTKKKNPTALIRVQRPVESIKVYVIKVLRIII